MQLSTVLVIALTSLTVGVAASALWFQARRVSRRGVLLQQSADEARLAIELAGSEATTYEPVRGHPAPVPPPELVNASAAGECVLFIGTGLGAELGQRTWREALFAVVNECQRDEPDDPLWSRLATEVRDARYDLVAELLVTRLGRQGFLDKLRDAVGVREHKAGSSIHRALRGVRFAGVMSGGWDQLAAELFADRDPVVLSPDSAEVFGETLRRRDFFVLQAYGSLSDPDPILTTDEFREQLAFRTEYALFLRSVYATRTMLFIGASVTGIEDYLRGAGLRGTGERVHYALVPRGPEADLHRDRLRERFNVMLLPYDADPGHPQVRQFAQELARLDRERRRVGGETGREPAPLTMVSLRNVGPFTELDLEFKSGWNTLVADNGCGKSTVLRAVAMALCGNDDRAARAASRLLRAGQTAGSIELRFGSDTFVTRLIRDGRRVRVESELVTPVQSGEWLALGFPPLRGVSTSSPQPPTGQRPLGPGVEDLLPLVTGDVDERLDDLKQWIVNRAFAEIARRDWIGRAGAGSAPPAVERLFRVASALMPEMGFWMKFNRIDEETLEVIVETPDGELPLHQLSQGMSSVLGWIGTLIARLDDVQAAGLPPGGMHGIVLVDEIDAHLHPKWQRKIVKAIQDEFSDIQFIATTHSPLILGSIREARVFHLRRVDGRIVGQQFDHDYHGLRADQILAGPPFETSPRDEESEKLLSDYRRLATLDHPTDEQRHELERVAATLRVALPSAAEREEARKARELITQATAKQIEEIPPPDREKVLAELKLQVQEAITRSGRPD